MDTTYHSNILTTYHSNILVETLSLLDCAVKNFNFIHPVKNIFFDNIDQMPPIKLVLVFQTMQNNRFFAIHVILALTNLNVPIVTTGMSSLIHTILDFVMHVVLNMPNSLLPKPLLFVLTVLIDTLSLLFPKNLETGSGRIALDSIYCLLLPETPFPSLPINLLPINSKRKNFLTLTIFLKIFLFVMNLA